MNKPSPHNVPREYRDSVEDNSPEPVTPPPIIPSPDTPTVHKGWKDIASTILILISAPLIALLLTAFVFQSYEVDGPSMEPTLQNHDRLIVFKVERTLARITKHEYIPHRGDVIIFNLRGEFDFDSGQKQLVKRVIALPGERVVVKDGVITVYNQAHPQGFEPDKTLGYLKNIPESTGNLDLVVPSGKLFVCGDNRPNSLDSRSFGPIDANDVVGRLGIRLFPINKAKKF